MPFRPCIIVTLILAAMPLGCGGRVEMALVDPDKYEFYSCKQLEREIKTLRERAQELRGLYQRAARDSTTVARIAYEPDYLVTIGNMRLIETAAREKDCDPPIAAAGPPARSTID